MNKLLVFLHLWIVLFFSASAYFFFKEGEGLAFSLMLLFAVTEIITILSLLGKKLYLKDVD